MHIVIDHCGKTFGRLTVISEGPREPTSNGQAGRTWNCVCSCGRRVVRPMAQFCPKYIARHEVSCGCAIADGLRKRNLKHGFGGVTQATSEYRIWKGMRKRCSPGATKKEAECYFLRGIRVCERWNDYTIFLQDMGPRPSTKHSIDRINNDGPYSPENCRWATPREQGRNKRTNIRLTINGQTKTLLDWADHYGMDAATVRSRISQLGWSPERALTTPIRVAA